MRVVALAILTALVTARPARVRAEEACVTCHPNVAAEYRGSVHAQDVGCTGCHGGDPTLTSVAAHASDKGYVGKPARTNVPTLCASCHADPARMRGSGLPTDQYAQYETSAHGIRLARGDERVAVCTDCHGTHRILASDEPTSPVFRENVPATCGRCHADAQLMAAYQLPADQLERFRASVHGVALLVDEHPAAPTCATCHGAHATNQPQSSSLAEVCGHCHLRTREYLERGPHGKAVAAGKLSECVGCHGSHDIPQPGHALFDTACRRCHADDDPARARVEQLKSVLVQADAELAAAGEELARAARLAPTLARYRPRLQQGTAYLMEALPLQHTLDVERVADLARSARSVADEVRAAVYGAEQERRAHLLLLGAVWLFILFAVGVIRGWRRERRRAAAPRDGGGD